MIDVKIGSKLTLRQLPDKSNRHRVPDFLDGYIVTIIGFNNRGRPTAWTPSATFKHDPMGLKRDFNLEDFKEAVQMDVVVNETPVVEQGDIILVDDMMRGRQLQVMSLSLDLITNGKSHHYTCGLYDIANHRIYKVFRTLHELQMDVDKISMCSIKKSSDYVISLRKK